MYNLAQCYANTGKSAPALKIFKHLLEQTDFELASEILYYRIGSVHFAQGKIPEARAALEKVIALDPQAEPARALLKRLPPSP